MTRKEHTMRFTFFLIIGFLYVSAHAQTVVYPPTHYSCHGNGPRTCLCEQTESPYFQSKVIINNCHSDLAFDNYFSVAMKNNPSTYPLIGIGYTNNIYPAFGLLAQPTVSLTIGKDMPDSYWQPFTADSYLCHSKISYNCPFLLN